MKRSVILYIAMSLDGYIATEDESLTWLFQVQGDGDNGYADFYQTVDVIIMGRKTYDWIMKEEKGNFPYKNKKCYVFSRSEHDNNEYVEFITCDIVDFVNKLKTEDGKGIWIVGGGELLSSLVRENVVDEYILNIAPAIIGSGIPLFKKQQVEISLELKSIRRFNQFAELHYIKYPQRIIHSNL